MTKQDMIEICYTEVLKNIALGKIPLSDGETDKSFLASWRQETETTVTIEELLQTACLVNIHNMTRDELIDYYIKNAKARCNSGNFIPPNGESSEIFITRLTTELLITTTILLRQITFSLLLINEVEIYETEQERNNKEN